MYTCILFMRKWKLLPSIPGCGLHFPPQKASEIPMGRGLIQEKAISKEVGSDSEVFFPGTLKQGLLFLLMILH